MNKRHRHVLQTLGIVACGVLVMLVGLAVGDHGDPFPGWDISVGGAIIALLAIPYFIASPSL